MHYFSDDGFKFLKGQGWVMMDHSKALLSRCATCVNKEMVAFPLKQHEYDALVIFCFEIGIGPFKNSATLLQLKSGNIVKALSIWRSRCRSRNKKGKLVIDDLLVQQREAELAIYLSGDYHQNWRKR